jgi:hypothetical protein
MNKVSVIEDSGCQVNFISRPLIRTCNLKPDYISPRYFATLMGTFTSDQWCDVTWLGKSGNKGCDMFYIAPEGAPIEVLVGTQFSRDHPDVFDRMLPEPAFLNVQGKMKASNSCGMVQ